MAARDVPIASGRAGNRRPGGTDQIGTAIGRTARRLTVLAIGLGVAATGTAVAHGSGGYGGGGVTGGGGRGPFGGTMGLWGLLWTGLLLAIAAFLVYVFLARGRDHGSRPLPAPRERYARGDLSEEFDRRSERLDRTDRR